MGPKRDAELIGGMEDREYGNQQGRSAELHSIAADLGVDPGVIESLYAEQSLPNRVERLQIIADSVGGLLEEATRECQLAQSDNPELVARFMIDDQLAEQGEERDLAYFETDQVYRFGVDESGSVQVLTGVWGGGMFGPFQFRKTIDLNPEWVANRLSSRGVERDTAFAAQVIEAIHAELTTSGDQVG